jgi:leucyl aminopeptidase (aminopeptidase T)
MDNKMIETIFTANNIICNLLAVKEGEEVLICIDPETDMRMANALAAAAQQCKAEYTIAIMPSRNANNATTIPRVVEEAMNGADVYIGMTRTSGASVYNSKMKELLGKKKIRECSMVLRDIDNYIKGGALANYEIVYSDGKRLAEIWKGKKICKITTPAGTYLTAEMISDEPIIECGIARKPGDSMAFSDGEVSVGPVENTMNGTLIIDGPMCYFGEPNKPIEMKIVIILQKLE